MAGVGRAGDHLAVASYPWSTTGGEAVVEAATPRTTPQGRAYHVRNTARGRLPQNNSCSGGRPVSSHYGLR